MSCSVPLSACPMCSSPVTFGGGTAMEYFGFELPASALKSCASSQRADQAGSTACGAYADGIDFIWAYLYLESGGRAGACVSLERERRPGYAYVDLPAARHQSSLYPAVERPEEACEVVAVDG